MHLVFGFGFALLLIIASFAIADTTEETTEAVEAPAPKKSPIKIGGAMRRQLRLWCLRSEESPHPRGEKIGDVDLEIFRPQCRS